MNIYEDFHCRDDLVIAESLANELSKWNYEVHVIDNFEKIMEDFQSRTTTRIIRYQSTNP